MSVVFWPSILSDWLLRSMTSDRAIGFSFGDSGDGGGVNGLGGVSGSLFMLIFSLSELFDICFEIQEATQNRKCVSE